MKNIVKFLSLSVLGLASAACGSPEQMAETAETVNATAKCEPEILEVVAGQISATVTVDYPEGYFHPQAILEVTPVIVYEGGEAKMKPFVFQGENVKDNYQVVPKKGASISKKVNFEYVPGMEKCYLELRSVLKHKAKQASLPTVKVADGANTTYMLVSKTGKIDYKADNYQDLVPQTAEGQILYQINSSEVRNTELRSQSIQDFKAALEEIKANDRMNVVSTDIIAYASPDGKEEDNAELSDNRSKSAEKVLGQLTRTTLAGTPVNVTSVGEDWEGFQELVAASDLDDKELIIRVLSMYSDPAIREKEIRNMSAVYQSLAQEVLPELRRARFIANVEYENYTSEELLEIIDSNIDVLDEESLLRAATLVEDNDDKITIYKQAVSKYDSARGKYNLGVTYANMGRLAEAKKALEGLEQDEDWCNAMGVIAMMEEDFNVAAEYLAYSNNATAVENAAVIDIIDGEYAAAAAKLAGKNTYNAALAQLLAGNCAPALNFSCDCPNAAYLRAVAAARMGQSSAVKSNLAAAKADAELAERAAKDVEFAQYR